MEITSREPVLSPEILGSLLRLAPFDDLACRLLPLGLRLSHAPLLLTGRGDRERSQHHGEHGASDSEPAAGRGGLHSRGTLGRKQKTHEAEVGEMSDQAVRAELPHPDHDDQIEEGDRTSGDGSSPNDSGHRTSSRDPGHQERREPGQAGEGDRPAQARNPPPRGRCEIVAGAPRTAAR